MSKDSHKDFIFKYELMKYNVFEDIEKSFNDPVVQKKFNEWLENKKRLKTESAEDSFKSNSFTLRV